MDTNPLLAALLGEDIPPNAAGQVAISISKFQQLCDKLIGAGRRFGFEDGKKEGFEEGKRYGYTKGMEKAQSNALKEVEKVQAAATKKEDILASQHRQKLEASRRTEWDTAFTAGFEEAQQLAVHSLTENRIDMSIQTSPTPTMLNPPPAPNPITTFQPTSSPPDLISPVENTVRNKPPQRPNIPYNVTPPIYSAPTNTRNISALQSDNPNTQPFGSLQHRAKRVHTRSSDSQPSSYPRCSPPNPLFHSRFLPATRNNYRRQSSRYAQPPPCPPFCFSGPRTNRGFHTGRSPRVRYQPRGRWIFVPQF
jgi:hypothetical protein